MIAVRIAFVLASPLLLAAGPVEPAAGAPASSSACVTCHAKLEGDAHTPVAAWATDVHAAAGLGCEACHGGDPSAAHADDDAAAMDPKRGFRPAPDRLHIPEFCARCHSDAAYMKRFDPKARVDQLVEYRTSTHGRLNAGGDPVPATCIDCHGAHGIRPVSSPDSSTYATNVPATCARCHSDAKRMAPYKIPTDQYARYRGSVHAAALLDRGDTAAPACNDCHGNHGAAPPSVLSVANVCGQCHGREASLFRASRKKALFDDLDVPECTVCHENHGIRHPTPELFHSGSAPQVSAGKITAVDPFAADLGDVAAGAEATAVWRVALEPHVAPDAATLVHHVEVSAEGMPPIVLDATVRPGTTPEDAARAAGPSGLTATLAITPLAGAPVEPGDAVGLQLALRAGNAPVKGVRVKDVPGQGLHPIPGSACRSCHEEGDACDAATEKMYAALSTLDADLRRAAGELHRAEVAGMEVADARFELKSKGATAAIEARALVHAFDPERLVARAEEGRKVAASANRAARDALAELEFRRKGLAASLVLVGLVLLGLYLRIRQIDRLRAATSRASILAVALLLGASGAEAQNACVTAACHGTLLSKSHVHPPTESCDSCHEVTSAQHPQKGKTTFKLSQPAAELCAACHDAFGKKHVHAPVKDGKCVTCHDPHASDEPKLLARPMKALCTSCHAEVASQPHVHGPVSAGKCTACHNPHESDAERLLVEKGDALCANCHPDVMELKKKAHVHGALEGGCTSCHDPHGSPYPRLLADEGSALCFTCHDTIAEKVESSPSVHAALKGPRACAACHAPHASDQPKLLAASQRDVCLGCHKTVVTPAMTTLHAPVRDGACTACHDAHGSSNPKLLAAEFRTTPYVPYTDGEYALCFGCHKRDLVRYADTSFATGFRDGERNLHFVHVNDPRKGRSCILCHELHGSSQPKLVAVSVPFGTWSLPLKFVKTDTGGSCAPGCHEPRGYDRKTPVKKS